MQEQRWLGTDTKTNLNATQLFEKSGLLDVLCFLPDVCPGVSANIFLKKMV